MRAPLKKHAFMIAMLLLATMLAGCAQPTPTPAPSPAPKEAEPTKDTRATLIFAERDDPVWLNPILEKAGQDTRNNRLMFDSLFNLDENNQIVPKLATSYTISEDGMEYTVKLHENAKWHDGTPVTADDVVFTFMAHMHPKVPSRYKTELWALMGYAEITDTKNPRPFSDFNPVVAVDKHTVKFRLSQPYAPFLMISLVQRLIVPKHLLEKDLENMEQSEFNQKPVGSGPFKLVQWKRDEALFYEAFDDYHLGKPGLKGVVYRIIPDVTVQGLELEKGTVHGMGVTTLEMFTKFDEHPDINAITTPATGYSTIQFICDHPLWADKRVRQAIAYGIDKERAVREYLGPLGTVAWSPIPPVRGWAHNPNIKPYPYNPSKAMQLLNEAGWRLDDKGVLRNQKGEPFEFELGTFVGVERAFMNVIFQENLRHLGINAKVATRASAEQMYIMYDAKGPDVTFINWGMPLDPDPEMWRRHHSSEMAYNNYYNWSHPRMDELLELGRAETDQDKRQQYYWEMQEILHEELPGLVVFWRAGMMAFRKNVKGYRLASGSGWLAFINEVSMDP